MANRSPEKRATLHQESTVNNWFAIDTEVAHRRMEYERAVAEASSATLAQPERGQPRWTRRPGLNVLRLTLTRLAARALPMVAPVDAHHCAIGEAAPGD
jgi:hypothetical protein